MAAVEVVAAVEVLEAEGQWGWEAFSREVCQNYGRSEVRRSLNVVTGFFTFMWLRRTQTNRQCLESALL